MALCDKRAACGHLCACASGHRGPCHCTPIASHAGRPVCSECSPPPAPPPFVFGAVCDVCGELVAGTRRTRHAACEAPARGCGAALAPWRCGELMPVGSVALCDRCAGIK